MWVVANALLVLLGLIFAAQGVYAHGEADTVMQQIYGIGNLVVAAVLIGAATVASAVDSRGRRIEKAMSAYMHTLQGVIRVVEDTSADVLWLRETKKKENAAKQAAIPPRAHK